MSNTQGTPRYSLTLSIPEIPKSLNRANQGHWATRHRYSLGWKTRISIACLGKLPKSPLPMVSIEIIRHSDRTLDFDGAVASMKPVVDALVTAGVMIDDSWKVTGAWLVDQKFRPKSSGPILEIRIRERRVTDT